MKYNPRYLPYTSLTGREAVIDEDIRGWARDNHDKLQNYVSIKLAGKNGDLPELDTDSRIAAYCKEHDCDLITADKKAYMNHFDSITPKVQITLVDHWFQGNRPIYCITMLK